MCPAHCCCKDPKCPECKGDCMEIACTTVLRSDQEDHTGTPMCGNCAADAIESGVFYIKEEEN